MRQRRERRNSAFVRESLEGEVEAVEGLVTPRAGRSSGALRVAASSLAPCAPTQEGCAVGSLPWRRGWYVAARCMYSSRLAEGALKGRWKRSLLATRNFKRCAVEQAIAEALRTARNPPGSARYSSTHASSSSPRTNLSATRNLKSLEKGGLERLIAHAERGMSKDFACLWAPSASTNPCFMRSDTISTCKWDGQWLEAQKCDRDRCASL